ncbi:hypothetical protein FQR65_LT13510 [Abscondita terminalis]|nr:hypothetical protein FQR65_LT13510 [Abscondita terminalis]
MENFKKGTPACLPHMFNDEEEPKTENKSVIEGVSFGHSVGIKDDLDVDDNDVGEKKRMAFLDLMVEASQNGLILSNEEIKEEVDTIIFEGHDTTAAASSFFLCLMAAHPNIQKKGKNVLKGFIELFNTNSRETVEKLRKHNENIFDCHDYMSEATVEMLLETVMGVSKNTQDEGAYEYAMAVMKMCEIIHLRQFKFWLRPNWLFNLTKYKNLQKRLLNIIHTLTRKVINNKMENFKKGIKDDLDVDDNDVGEKKRMAFLDLMVEASQNGLILSNEEIKEEVDTIIFEGHDTTAAASSFFLCLMAAHPNIQKKVHQEIDAIFENSNRPATFADTLEMKYLERCLLETLRLYPPVPIIARKLNQDVKLASDDYILPAGCTVLIATFKVHRRGDIYENPDTFDPENFDSRRTVNRHYYSFIPFSAGPRSCVGRKYAMLKLKILLSTIMRNFVVKSHKKESDFELQGDIILKRADGFLIKLEARQAFRTK